mmetsp:Transcript_13665/g.39557  ORF Transcript_13665/g.39557 Transcript_13665/m.39557 type:complete len:104 (-) Transcript_13665:1489-1800(-)
MRLAWSAALLVVLALLASPCCLASRASYERSFVRQAPAPDAHKHPWCVAAIEDIAWQGPLLNTVHVHVPRASIATAGAGQSVEVPSPAPAWVRQARASVRSHS